MSNASFQIISHVCFTISPLNEFTLFVLPFETINFLQYLHFPAFSVLLIRRELFIDQNESTELIKKIR